jgi:hypothetical protein
MGYPVSDEARQYQTFTLTGNVERQSAGLRRKTSRVSGLPPFRASNLPADQLDEVFGRTARLPVQPRQMIATGKPVSGTQAGHKIRRCSLTH